MKQCVHTQITVLRLYQPKIAILLPPHVWKMISNILSSILSWVMCSDLLCSGLFGYINPSGLCASLNLAFTAPIRHSSGQITLA